MFPFNQKDEGSWIILNIKKLCNAPPDQSNSGWFAVLLVPLCVIAFMAWKWKWNKLETAEPRIVNQAQPQIDNQDERERERDLMPIAAMAEDPDSEVDDYSPETNDQARMVRYFGYHLYQEENNLVNPIVQSEKRTIGVQTIITVWEKFNVTLIYETEEEFNRLRLLTVHVAGPDLSPEILQRPCPWRP